MSPGSRPRRPRRPARRGAAEAEYKEKHLPGAISVPLKRLDADKSAPRYNRQIAFCERLLFGEGRRWVASQAQSDVLEFAVGTGRTLRYYPGDVRLTGVGLSPARLALARREAEEGGRQADLRVGDAQQLEFADASFDAVTCALSL